MQSLQKFLIAFVFLLLIVVEINAQGTTNATQPNPTTTTVKATTTAATTKAGGGSATSNFFDL